MSQEALGVSFSCLRYFLEVFRCKGCGGLGEVLGGEKGSAPGALRGSLELP